MSFVLRNDADGVATLTLNRPEKLNALNPATFKELRAHLDDVAGDSSVRCLVLTGAGRSFCAGNDLDAIASGEGRAAPMLGPETVSALEELPQPTIAKIKGHCFTGGLELALACDFLIASDRARFADTHARVGVMPGWGLTVLLAEAVGVRRARELSVTGNYIDAEVAASWGLVNHVITHADLLPFCHRLAADIVSNDQAGVRQMLDTYQQVISTTGDEAWDIEAEVSRAWAAEHLNPAAVEARRLAIVERGRSQQT